MPWLDLPEANLYYRSNVPNDDLTQLKHSRKETILLLHPLYLNTDFLQPQFENSHLNETYNLVAFDSIACGRTECPSYISGGLAAMHDFWVDAALVARFCQAFDLGPVHVFAVQCNSTNAALRFSLLFPSQCLSLTLCGVASQTERPELEGPFRELIGAWSSASTIDDLEEVLWELSVLCFNDNTMTLTDLDPVISYFEKHYCPTRLTNLLGTTPIYTFRVPLSSEEFAGIKSPVTIIHGDASFVYPVSVARDLGARLTHSSNGAPVRIIKGPDMLTLPKSSSSNVNEIFGGFLASLTNRSSTPRTRTWSEDPSIMHRALELNSRLARRHDIANRDPNDAFSFSRVSDKERLNRQQNWVDPWLEAERAGADLRNTDGSPIRPFSERSFQAFFPDSISQILVERSTKYDQ